MEQDYTAHFSHEGWRGRVRALSWLAAMDDKKRKCVDNELEKRLNEGFANEELLIPHRCSIVILKSF
ncbi:hypothetical protein AMI01nite_54330 [Aneurinibacillus migulanus]|nr:hypothetical protein AMI01nite_54330 [Aneurinibacillus migulanus]